MRINKIVELIQKVATFFKLRISDLKSIFVEHYTERVSTEHGVKRKINKSAVLFDLACGLIFIFVACLVFTMITETEAFEEWISYFAALFKLETEELGTSDLSPDQVKSFNEATRFDNVKSHDLQIKVAEKEVKADATLARYIETKLREKQEALKVLDETKKKIPTGFFGTISPTEEQLAQNNQVQESVSSFLLHIPLGKAEKVFMSQEMVKNLYNFIVIRNEIDKMKLAFKQFGITTDMLNYLSKINFAKEEKAKNISSMILKLRSKDQNFKIPFPGIKYFPKK